PAAAGGLPGPAAPSQAVLLHLAGQGVAVDAEDLRRRPDLIFGASQDAGDVAGFDFGQRQVGARRPVGERGLFTPELVRQVLHPQRLVRRDDHRALDHVAPPTRSISRSCTARRIFAWSARLMSTISSRNRVPFAACSNRPVLRVTAPVNAPFSCPNNSLSSRFSGIAAQLTATNGPDALAPFKWMARAMTSFPVPDSPWTRTVALLCATRAISL